MAVVTLIARLALGGLFLLLGANYFGNWIELPPVEGQAAQFIGALFMSQYLMVVKVLEILGGVLLLSGRFAPLGLAILLPIIVNINLYDILLVQKFNPAGALVTVLSLYLLVAYLPNFLPLFAAPASSGKKKLN